MKRYLRYLAMDIKKSFKTLPWLLAGAAALSLVTGAAAFCGYRLLYRDQAKPRLAAALVVEDESPLADGLLNYIENMEEFTALLSFTRTDRETGLNWLDKDQVSAVLVIPENTVQGILDGENTPVQVILKKDASLPAALLKELTSAGARSLSAAQAGIYAVYDIYAGYGFTQPPDEAFARLNVGNLRLFANRGRLFRENMISSTGSLTVSQYYIASGFVLFLLLWGISLSRLLKPESPALLKLLASRGIGGPGRTAARVLSVFLLYLSGLSGLFILGAALAKLPFLKEPFGLLKQAAGWQTASGTGQALSGKELSAALLCVMAILLFAAAYTVFLYRCAPTAGSGILLLFFTGVSLVFLSGGFLPPAFLPEGIRGFGSLLPSSVLIRQTGRILGGQFQADPECLRSILYLLFGSALLGLLTALMSRVREEARP